MEALEIAAGVSNSPPIHERQTGSIKHPRDIMGSANKQDSRPWTTFDPASEPIHPRLEDFLREPLADGNRNVMLPDGPKSGDAVAQLAQERAKEAIESVEKVLH
ncbi:hypothetical protein GGS23DRAFT_595592 [Durotheca rogersii]|uniref:uncharacterized protein n=1 Tax=Durotheca rogersii TaxID=419775 RepID=UPI002220D4BF|nr:uncharacterized protein GGS23DRAFT_595592 [Durotheca rogersii]KAI5864901.1 hypothetical protein GGS23DRAFT_595592 [Durotheca rogersii]